MRSLFLFCSALIVSGASSAQQSGEVSLQFISFPKTADPQPVELLIGDGKTILVDLPTNSLSQVYRVPRLSKWVLGKTVTGKEGKTAFEVHGEASAIASSKQLVLVTRNGDAGAGSLIMTSFDSDTDGFGGGAYVFFNASKVDIAATVGETKFSLKPKAHKLVHPEPSKTKGDRKYLYTYLYFRKGEEAVPFYSSTWRFSTRARCFVFFHHDPHTGQLRTHTIRDYIE